jgi:hypothetical protein
MLTATETASLDKSAPPTGFSAIFDPAMITTYATAAPCRVRERRPLALMPSTVPNSRRSNFDPLNWGS